MNNERIINDTINYGKSLIGVPYKPWGGNDIEKGEPMFAVNEPIPSKDEIKSCNCAGFLNLLHRFRNKKLPYNNSFIGGTDAYYYYYLSKSDDFNINTVYPKGTLIIKNFRDYKDQGHVAIIIEDKGKESLVLQSHFDEYVNGINMYYTLDKSHKNYNYEKIVLPDNWLI